MTASVHTKWDNVMMSRTKQLANGVIQALLDLPDPLLGETIEEWLRGVETGSDDLEISDSYHELCGYQPRSESSGIGYTSLDALYEKEPDTTAFTWLAPSPERLREVLSALRPEQIYHEFLQFVDDGLQHHAFLPALGFPPLRQGPGYAYMSQVTLYFQLLKRRGAMTRDQFEAICQEYLEVALEEKEQAERAGADGDFPDHEPGTARGRDTEFYRSLLRADERSLDFEITLLNPDTKLRDNLLQALKRLECSWTIAESGKIEGSCEYKVWKKTETRAVGRLKDLLNRWQEDGRLTWSGLRLKPLKPHPKRRKRARR